LDKYFYGSRSEQNSSNNRVLWIKSTKTLLNQDIMANKKQLAILRQGVDVWNEWRRENYEIEIDLSGAELSEANLIEVNLYGANLYEANLYGANLSQADLIEAKLIEAKLIEAKLIEANLSRANLIRANLYGANLYGANLSRADLIRVNLIEADLSQANLIEANLRGGNLRRANLNESNISTTNALGTNFKGAILTGACIEYWNINSQTNLDEVICDYIYQKRNQQERRPHNPEKNFAPGEFTKLFQKALETVDLIFNDGIDWQAFLISFQKLQIECGSDELSIQSFENKGDGVFVVRVNVPPGAEKAEVEKYLKKQYLLEAKLETQSRELANLYEITKLLATRPINIYQIQGNNMAGDRNIKTDDYYEQSGTIGIGHMSGGEIKDGAKVAGIINEAEQQNLADAATEIQQLLEQLSKTYPTTTSKEKNIIIGEMVDRIESNPTLKTKVTNALKSGSKEAFKEAVNHPLVNILVATIEGWQEAE
jgi:uncharacterized protein YjbI with pentapeptide repeats